MVSNFYVNDMFRNLTTFIGTFSCDTIPLPPSLNQISYWIVNTSMVNQLGGHFITLIYDGLKKKLFYLDSFGLDVSNVFILKYMYTLTHEYMFNPVCIQPLHSNYCAFYAMGFIIEYRKSQSLVQFINMFNVKYGLQNDRVVINYIIKNCTYVHNT